MRQFIWFAAAILALLAGSVAVASNAEIPVPDGYVLQVMDPTDGRIARPKDWFYASHGLPSGWEWIISAEDPRRGSYDTGMRIQMFIGIDAAGVGKANFVQGNLEQKRKGGKVVRTCEPEDLSDFTRACVEVLEITKRPDGSETRFRVAYSFLTSKSMDMVAVTIFGAPESEWAVAAPILDVMSRFILIGPNFRP